MKRKILSLILSFCMIVCMFPLQSFAEVQNSENVIQTLSFNNSNNGKTLVLRNDYISFYFYDLYYQTYLATVPTAIAKDIGDPFTQDLQASGCQFTVYTGGGKKKTTYPFVTLKKAEFVSESPNGKNPAIKAEYNMEIGLYGLDGIKDGTILPAKVTVYHELVCLDEKGKTAWGVLTSVSEIQMDRNDLPEMFMHDFDFEWWYVMNNFTGMGHGDTANKPGGPAIKMDRTTVTESGERTTEKSVVTSKISDMSTKHVPKGYSEWGDIDGVYVNEIHTDAYPWANPFVGLSDYYETDDIVYCGGSPLRVRLPQTVTVRPNDAPVLTWVESRSFAGFTFEENAGFTDGSHYLWGYRDLVKFEENLPTNPDEVSSSLNAKRLAAFKTQNGVSVEYVADDAALESLKRKYNSSPIAQISGEYESKNGSSFEFTNGYAMLSPTVTATWNSGAGGKLIITSDGKIEQNGVNLNAPTFKFYQPESGAEELLKIELTQKGFSFEFEPDRNEAVIFVDIPYATSKLEKAFADAEGNLIFSGEIGFKTIFNGAEFSLEKLGYGLKEKTSGNQKTYEFKVNGVAAKGSFDTAALMTLELAKVEGEVNTFKGEERYDFELELNAFDLFETQAKLALQRSNKGVLLPDELWFYVKSSPGIVLVPPIPIGQLNGGGAGFKDLADTVNGDYFAIPPLKLRGALTGTYLHLIEGTGNVTIGPSEISLKATDVNIVGAGDATQIIDSFGYSLKLNGQERNYKNETYKGIYFAGSKELSMNLPSKTIDILDFEASVELGAFGGLNEAKDNLYLAIGANGVAKGVVQIPKKIWLLGGLKFVESDINLIIGAQSAFPIRGVSVGEAMKKAFDNADIYLGAMAQVSGKIADARVWVIVPKIVQTNFRKGAGWDIEVKLHNKLSNWDWESRGITPVVQSLPRMELLENSLVTSADINVETNSEDETPYILLSFDKDVTEEEIKASLNVAENTIYWTQDGAINPDAQINAATNVMANNKDGEMRRVVILRMKTGGTYHISANTLAFKHEEAVVEPFEKLDLTQSENKLSGSVKYPQEGEKYVLRTYLSNEKGGADYLVDEREIENADNIEINVSQSGTAAPTGKYYLSAFLMTQKQTDINDDNEKETVLAAIDSKMFEEKIDYTNTNEPSSPENVLLESVGNEVMRAKWNRVDDADGYALRIYQKQDGSWIDTGFGYDVDKNTDSIDMALTVGANAVSVSENETTPTSVAAENLQADKDYKVGVRAYKKSEDAKYYSLETESAEKFLPKYTPVDMQISVNNKLCSADENGIYNAYAKKSGNILSVSANESAAVFTVTRMDTNETLAASATENTFEIPEFEGSLMFKIDGRLNNDVTSEYLIINISSDAPHIMLSSDVFYADKNTGEYQITGMASAGSKIIYGDNAEVFAGSDGKFVVSGTLEEDENSASVMLYAMDLAENISKPQLAIISKKTAGTVTVKDSYSEKSGSGEYEESETVTIDAGSRSGYKFSGWTADCEVAFEDAKSSKTTFVMPNSDVTVTANWVKESGSSSGTGSGGTVRYSVSFETNGGQKISSQNVMKNGFAKEPEAPKKDGFDFAGWYTDKELKTKYDFSSKVTKSFTLYAAWTKADNSENEIILIIGEKTAQVFGNNKTNDVAPKVVNNRTMLPTRFVAESLGADVSWDAEKQLVTIKGKNLKTGDDVEIHITIGAEMAKVNEKEIKLDSCAFVENNRTYTPIRFICENLGADVDWIEKEQKVVITRPETK